MEEGKLTFYGDLAVGQVLVPVTFTNVTLHPTVWASPPPFFICCGEGKYVAQRHILVPFQSPFSFLCLDIEKFKTLKKNEGKANQLFFVMLFFSSFYLSEVSCLHRKYQNRGKIVICQGWDADMRLKLNLTCLAATNPCSVCLCLTSQMPSRLYVPVGHCEVI